MKTPGHKIISEMFRYVLIHKPLITHQKCVVATELLCDMRCPLFRIHMVEDDEFLLANCFCYKFEPPEEITTLQISPLKHLGGALG